MQKYTREGGSLLEPFKQPLPSGGAVSLLEANCTHYFEGGFRSYVGVRAACEASVVVGLARLAAAGP